MATTTPTRSRSRAARAADAAERDQAANRTPAAPKETPQQPKEPAAAVPAGLTATAKRTATFRALCAAAGDLLDKWDAPGVTRDEARQILAHRLSYCGGVPADYWDPRLGPVPTGRGKTA